MSSFYEQVGGESAVDAAVDLFYRKVLTDDRIARFFDDVAMDRQSAKQKAFLTMVLGGPCYSGQDMRRGHLHLVARGMTDEHVDAVIELLGRTLAELGVKEELIRQVAAVEESVRDDVLDRPVGSPRGMGGGWVLARPAGDVNILDVVNAVDPVQRITSCPLGLTAHGTNLCPLHRKLDDALAHMENAFGTTPLSDILKTPGKSKPLCDVPSAGGQAGKPDAVRRC